MSELSSAARVLERLLRRRPVRVTVHAEAGSVTELLRVCRLLRGGRASAYRLLAEPATPESLLPQRPREYAVDLPLGLMAAPDRGLEWLRHRLTAGEAIPLIEVPAQGCPGCGADAGAAFCPQCGTQIRLRAERLCPGHADAITPFCGACGLEMLETRRMSLLG